MTAIEYKGQRVITTAMLAEVYHTDINNVRKNFSNHQKNFINGVHYFYLQGDELREFKRHMNNILVAPPASSHLYLWTERGANRHCKILDTDKAWEQFENLEETYFRVKEAMKELPKGRPDAIKYLNGLANYLRIQRTIMLESGCTAYEVAVMDKMTCEACGVAVPESLAKPREKDERQFYLDPAKMPLKVLAPGE